MSSGVSYSQRLNLWKSNRDTRELSYEQEANEIENSLNSNLSDSLIDRKENTWFNQTSFITMGKTVGNRQNEVRWKPLSRVKMSSWNLNQGIPFQKINQISDTPSIELDFNDWMDEEI